MRALIAVFAASLLVGCAKDCPDVPPPTPPGYVCGPRSAYAFAPVTGTEVKLSAAWRVRTVTDAQCVALPESALVVKNSDKEYVLVAIHPPIGEEGAAGGRPCGTQDLLIPVRQWALIAEEARLADDEESSNAARVSRLEHARSLSAPPH